MKVHLLVCHYREAYPGEHAPNVMLAADEYLLDDNPSWWTEAVAAEKAKVGDEAAAWAEVVVEVDGDALLDALYPSRRVLSAPVADTAALPGLLEKSYDPAVHDPRIGQGTHIDFEGADGETVRGTVGRLTETGYAVAVQHLTRNDVSGDWDVDVEWVNVDARHQTASVPADDEQVARFVHPEGRVCVRDDATGFYFYDGPVRCYRASHD